MFVSYAFKVTNAYNLRRQNI